MSTKRPKNGPNDLTLELQRSKLSAVTEVLVSSSALWKGQGAGQLLSKNFHPHLTNYKNNGLLSLVNISEGSEEASFV